MDKSFLSLKNSQEYMGFWNFCKPPHAGYAGTGFLTKYAPLNVSYGLGYPEHDAEGRIIT